MHIFYFIIVVIIVIAEQQTGTSGKLKGQHLAEQEKTSKMVFSGLEKNIGAHL
jgi:hypothetical protein